MLTVLGTGVGVVTGVGVAVDGGVPLGVGEGADELALTPPHPARANTAATATMKENFWREMIVNVLVTLECKRR